LDRIIAPLGTSDDLIINLASVGLFTATESLNKFGIKLVAITTPIEDLLILVHLGRRSKTCPISRGNGEGVLSELSIKKSKIRQ